MNITGPAPTARFSQMRIAAYWVMICSALLGGKWVLKPGEPDELEFLGYCQLVFALGLGLLLWVTGGQAHQLVRRRVSLLRRLREGLRQLTLPLLALLPVGGLCVFIYCGIICEYIPEVYRDIAYKRWNWADMLLPGIVADLTLAIAGLHVVWITRLLCRPLLVAEDGDRLIVYSLIGRRTLEVAGLQARRLLPAVPGKDGDAERTQGFILETDPSYSRFIRIALGARNWRQRPMLEQLHDWLVEHDVPVLDTRAVIAPSRLRQLGALAGEALVAAAIIAAAISLTLMAVHWLTWLRYGVMPLRERFWFSTFFLACLGGMLLLVTPLRAWVWKLADAVLTIFSPWGRRPGAMALYIAEAYPPPTRWASSTRRGWLRLEGDALVLRAGRRELRITRGQVQHLEPCGWRRRWLTLATPRQFSRPIELAWLDEQYEEHALLLLARGGRSFGHDRRLDRHLYQTMLDWLYAPELNQERMDGPDDVEPGRQPSALPRSLTRRPRVTAQLAAAFLLLGLAGPLLHNHLVMTRIRTGRWVSPAKIRPAQGLRPIIGGLAALEPGPIYYMEAKDERNPTQPVLCYGDPFHGPIRPLGFGTDFPLFKNIPGDRSHYLSDGEHGLATVLFPSINLQCLLRLRSYEDDSYYEQFPAQIVSAVNGKITELHHYFELFEYKSLFRDQRLFIRKIRNDSQHKVYHKITWLDLKTMQSHRLGRIADESVEDDRNKKLPIFDSPQFFPDGRHVLYMGYVIDIETRERKRICWACSPGESSRYDFSSIDNYFKQGNRLRVRVEDEQHPAGGNTITITEVWEIDPETARVEMIDRLPPNASLISADGDRWLLKSPVPDDDQKSIYWLYDHATGRSQGLFQAPTYNQNNPNPITVLLAGQSRYARWTGQDGWKVYEIKESTPGKE